MALFKESDLRARADRSTIYKSAASVLNEKVEFSAHVSQFDIFLSHSFGDQKLILGVWLSLEDLGYKVYVDWIHDRQLSRESVTKETATVLRERMRNCKSLFYATTENSGRSKWMPWELGYKDGDNSKSAIFPIAQYSSADTYSGQEYLGIYPYIAAGTVQGDTRQRLWVHTSATCYVLFDEWLNGRQPFQRG